MWVVGVAVAVGLGEATGTKHGGALFAVVAMAVISATRTVWKWKPANERDDNKLLHYLRVVNKLLSI